jgi:hypothetical protein
VPPGYTDPVTFQSGGNPYGVTVTATGSRSRRRAGGHPPPGAAARRVRGEDRELTAGRAPGGASGGAPAPAVSRGARRR